MILWTIQNLKAYEKMQQTGKLIANAEFIYKYHIPAYDFMVAKMLEKGLQKPDGIEYPVWAWYKWQGEHKRRDLRNTGLGNRGTKMVQLTIDVPETDVLLSDFDAWHAPLNGSYLALNEKDNDEFDALYFKFPKEKLYALKNKSWERIFDVFEDIGEFYVPSDGQRSIQACLWQVKKEQVKKAEFFTAR